MQGTDAGFTRAIRLARSPHGNRNSYLLEVDVPLTRVPSVPLDTFAQSHWQVEHANCRKTFHQSLPLAQGLPTPADASHFFPLASTDFLQLPSSREEPVTREEYE
jgi:hypothetical protein